MLFAKSLYLLIGKFQGRLIITKQVTSLGLPMAQSQFEFGDIFWSIAFINLEFLLSLFGLIKFETLIELSDLNHLVFGNILQRWKVGYKRIDSILHDLLCWSWGFAFVSNDRLRCFRVRFGLLGDFGFVGHI